MNDRLKDRVRGLLRQDDTLRIYAHWKRDGVTSKRLEKYSLGDVELTVRIGREFHRMDREAAIRRRRMIALVICGILSVCLMVYMIWRYA